MGDVTAAFAANYYVSSFFEVEEFTLVLQHALSQPSPPP
jgi:hypothetical protein